MSSGKENYSDVMENKYEKMMFGVFHAFCIYNCQIYSDVEYAHLNNSEKRYSQLIRS